MKSLFLNLSRNDQKLAIEALIFAAEEPISVKKLFDLLIANNIEFEQNNDGDDKQISINQEIMNKMNITPEYFIDLINEINLELNETNRPYQIINVAGGFQFATRSEYGELLSILTNLNLKRKFSQASLEVLSIIAYKQPITKPEIEQIRGVNSSEIVNSLLDKKLIKIIGRKDILGKPLMFGTTNLFLKTFGLKSLEDLPKLKELEELNFDEDLDKGQIELAIDTDSDDEIENLQKSINKDYDIEESYENNEDLFDDKLPDTDFEDNSSFLEVKISKKDFDRMKN